jgi:hypothetical protein
MTSTHRIFALAIAAAVLAGLILVLTGSGHAAELARSSWGVVASVARSSWG